MDKRILAIPIVLVVVIAVAGLYTATVPSIAADINVAGTVTVTIEKPSGIMTYETTNVVTTGGLNRVRDYLEGGTAGADNATEFISVSNDASPAAAWTNLPNELEASGFARADATTADGAAGIYTASYKFTCTATGPIPLQCAGLNWALENNTDSLWAAATFNATNMYDDDNITITWTITAESA